MKNFWSHFLFSGGNVDFVISGGNVDFVISGGNVCFDFSFEISTLVLARICVNMLVFMRFKFFYLSLVQENSVLGHFSPFLVFRG